MTDYDLKAEARGDLIIISDVTTGFFAVYAKAPGTRFLPPRFSEQDHAQA